MHLCTWVRLHVSASWRHPYAHAPAFARAREPTVLCIPVCVHARACNHILQHVKRSCPTPPGAPPTAHRHADLRSLASATFSIAMVPKHHTHWHSFPSTRRERAQGTKTHHRSLDSSIHRGHLPPHPTTGGHRPLGPEAPTLSSSSSGHPPPILGCLSLWTWPVHSGPPAEASLALPGPEPAARAPCRASPGEAQAHGAGVTRPCSSRSRSMRYDPAELVPPRHTSGSLPASAVWAGGSGPRSLEQGAPLPLGQEGRLVRWPVGELRGPQGSGAHTAGRVPSSRALGGEAGGRDGEGHGCDHPAPTAIDRVRKSHI